MRPRWLGPLVAVLVAAALIAPTVASSATNERNHHAALYIGYHENSNEQMCVPGVTSCEFYVYYPHANYLYPKLPTYWHSQDYMCGGWLSRWWESFPRCDSFSWNIGIQGDGGYSNRNVQAWGRKACPGGYAYSDVYSYNSTAWHVIWQVSQEGGPYGEHIHIWSGPYDCFASAPAWIPVSDARMSAARAGMSDGGD